MSINDPAHMRMCMNPNSYAHLYVRYKDPAILTLFFMLELKCLVYRRHVQETATLVNIVNELNNKWREVCRLLEPKGIYLHPDGFEMALAYHSYDMWKCWKKFVVAKSTNSNYIQML